MTDWTWEIMEATAFSRILDFLELFNDTLVKLLSFDWSSSELLLVQPYEVVDLFGKHHGAE
jgi:hypothetical protein